MIFTSERKAELLAFIDSLETSVDTAPLLLRIAELEAEVSLLTASVEVLQANAALVKSALLDAADLL